MLCRSFLVVFLLAIEVLFVPGFIASDYLDKYEDRNSFRSVHSNISDGLILYQQISMSIDVTNKGNNKITELRTIFQRESQNS